MKRITPFIFVLFFLTNCGGGYEINPVDQIIQDKMDSEAFSILLYDMDVRGNFSKDYFHKYRIIESKNGEVDEVTTDWMQVPERYFEKNADNLGMELAGKNEQGDVSKIPSPPGYSSFVGNEKYGRWTQRDGNSFWEFYGKFAFMNAMFNMITFPVRRNYYDTYYRDYYGRSTYYGPRTSGGYRTYGTNSSYSRKHKTSSNWSTSPNSSSFKSRVRSSVSRSSSRYSGSSSRSRSGGFGK
jgi:hypothetical protein